MSSIFSLLVQWGAGQGRHLGAVSTFKTQAIILWDFIVNICEMTILIKINIFTILSMNLRTRHLTYVTALNPNNNIIIPGSWEDILCVRAHSKQQSQDSQLSLSARSQSSTPSSQTRRPIASQPHEGRSCRWHFDTFFGSQLNQLLRWLCEWMLTLLF